MKYAAVLAVSGALYAQFAPVVPPGSGSGIVAGRLVTVTFSRQADTTFAVALGSRMKGISGFSTTMCNPDSAQPVTINGGMVSQLGQSQGISVIPPKVSAMVANTSRVNSKLYKAVVFSGQAGYYTALARAANVIKFAHPASGLAVVISMIPVIISHEAQRAADALAAQLPDPIATFGADALLDSDYTLAPGGCSTKLFLGSTSSPVQTAQGTVYGR